MCQVTYTTFPGSECCKITFIYVAYFGLLTDQQVPRINIVCKISTSSFTNALPFIGLFYFKKNALAK